MGYERLFHYTHSVDIAQAIAQSGVLIPNAPAIPAGIGIPEGYCEARVNLTTITPEEGVHAIQSGTGLVVKPEFGLEMLIDTSKHRLSQLFPDALPRSYHIIGDEPVTAKVTRTWNVERSQKRAEQGWRFKRFGSNLQYLSIALAPGNL